MMISPQSKGRGEIKPYQYSGARKWELWRKPAPPPSPRFSSGPHGSKDTIAVAGQVHFTAPMDSQANLIWKQPLRHPQSDVSHGHPGARPAHPQGAQPREKDTSKQGKWLCVNSSKRLERGASEAQRRGTLRKQPKPPG